MSYGVPSCIRVKRSARKDGTARSASPLRKGVSVHRVVVASEKNITLDPRQMVGEMKSAIRRWFTDLLNTDNAPRLAKVNGNLRFLVREQMKEHPGIGGIVFAVYSST